MQIQVVGNYKFKERDVARPKDFYEAMQKLPSREQTIFTDLAIIVSDYKNSGSNTRYPYNQEIFDHLNNLYEGVKTLSEESKPSIILTETYKNYL